MDKRHLSLNKAAIFIHTDKNALWSFQRNMYDLNRGRLIYLQLIYTRGAWVFGN